ncbi:MAG: zinc ribbon domain-containing protein [Nitrospirae bacterium]|nr:zinc ribbon domain-containing protein [Nitrospirota bacterium]
MPIYEYRCKKCNAAFSVLQKVGTTDTKCPKCSSKDTKKLLSTFACSCSEGKDFSTSVPSSFSGG